MTVTVTMSAVCLVIILYFSCAALSASERSEVLWRDFGGAVTIHCRSSEPDQEDRLNVKKGLNEDILTVDNSNKITIPAKNLLSRLHINGTFPNVDILIRNLNSEDTGLYWCGYEKGSSGAEKKDTNSVLLVVKEAAPEWWDISKENLILMSVVIFPAVLLSIVMGVLIWLIKTKTAYTAMKPRRDPVSHVYEIMTGRCAGDVCLQVTNEPETP